MQRRHRQFEGLRDILFCLSLAKRLAKAKVENQLKFLVRNSRGKDAEGTAARAIKNMRAELRGMDGAPTLTRYAVMKAWHWPRMACSASTPG